MTSEAVGFDHYQVLINTWSSSNAITEWVDADDVSPSILRRLKKLSDEGLLWHMFATNESGWVLEVGLDWYGPCEFCGKLEHLRASCNGSKGMGWSTLGFFVGGVPSTDAADFEVEYSLPCSRCNSNGDFDELDDDCPSCEGEGSVYVDYSWPGRSS